MIRFTSAIMLLVFALTTMSFAEEVPNPPATTGESSAESRTIDTTPHPTLSTNIHWARTLARTIVVMFILAILSGMVVRKTIPRKLPPAHSHDEPPGASGHHGQTGVVDHSAPDHQHD